MEYGWIKLSRKILYDKKFYTENTLSWISLLLMAAYRPGYVEFGKNEKIYLEIGQLAKSQISLAEMWGWSRTKVARYLAHLEKIEQISTQKTQENKPTVITIKNYKKYQFNNEKNDEKINSEKIKIQNVDEDFVFKCDKTSKFSDLNDIDNKMPKIITKKEFNLETKKRFFKYVFLTDDEYNLLLKKFGEKNAIDAIQELDYYLPNSQRKRPYKCHYRAICSWVIPKILEKNKFSIGKKSEASQQLVESFSVFSEVDNEA